MMPLIAEVLSREYTRPDGKKVRVSHSQLYEWLNRYENGLLEAIRPKQRKDIGQRRVKASPHRGEQLGGGLVAPVGERALGAVQRDDVETDGAAGDPLDARGVDARIGDEAGRRRRRST